MRTIFLSASGANVAHLKEEAAYLHMDITWKWLDLVEGIDSFVTSCKPVPGSTAEILIRKRNVMIASGKQAKTFLKIIKEYDKSSFRNL